MKKTAREFITGRVLIPAALAAAAVLVLAACAPAVEPAGGAPQVPPGKGIVNIQLGIDDTGVVPSASAARTLLPAAPLSFSSYDLAFTPEVDGEPAAGAEPVTRDGIPSLTGIELDAGTYTLVLKAYSGTDVAAEGTVSGVEVTEGENTQASVPLVFKTTETGTGTLGVTVTNTSGLTLSQAVFNWTPLSGGTGAGSESLTVSGLSGSKVLKAGYYLVTVTLSAGDRTAKRSDAAHIGAGQTTPLTWDFIAGDFSTDVTAMWLVEKNGSTWGIPNSGNKLEEQAAGTFVWQGSLTTGSFRFDLNDESSPDYFQPAVDGTAITPSTPASMTFASGDTGTETAWSLAAGNYRFAVNPLAKTVTVTSLAAAEYAITATQVAGGSFTVTADGTDVTEAAEETTITLTATPDTGYRFKEWAVTGVTLDDDTANPVTFDMPAGTVTVTAEFERVYTVTFNAMGGTGGPVPVTVTAGSQVTAPDVTEMAKESETDPAYALIFGGWFTDTTLRYPIEFPITVSGDITAYAKWDNGKALRIWQNTSYNRAGQTVFLTQGVSYTLGAEYKFGSTYAGGNFAVTYGWRYKGDGSWPITPYIEYKEHENPQTWTISERTFTAPADAWYCFRFEDSGRTNGNGKKSDKEIYINRAWLYAEGSTENMLKEADFGDYPLYETNYPNDATHDSFLDDNGIPQYFNDAQNNWDQHCINHWGITGGSNFGGIATVP